MYDISSIYSRLPYTFLTKKVIEGNVSILKYEKLNDFHNHWNQNEVTMNKDNPLRYIHYDI